MRGVDLPGSRVDPAFEPRRLPERNHLVDLPPMRDLRLLLADAGWKDQPGLASETAQGPGSFPAAIDQTTASPTGSNSPGPDLPGD